jgi:hypothetical protein
MPPVFANHAAKAVKGQRPVALSQHTIRVHTKAVGPYPLGGHLGCKTFLGADFPLDYAPSDIVFPNIKSYPQLKGEL